MFDMMDHLKAIASITIMILVVGALILLVYCVSHFVPDYGTVELRAVSETPPENAGAERFWLEGTGLDYIVRMDHATGVYYLIVMTPSGEIAVTELVNPDGSPSRADDADMDDVRADIAANLRRLEEAQ